MVIGMGSSSYITDASGEMYSISCSDGILLDFTRGTCRKIRHKMPVGIEVFPFGELRCHRQRILKGVVWLANLL